ncbi:Aldose 1-epimerase [Lecanosticta acicola]|uniref:Aldose 1-epimerase n=1 Tax=Lecanosticta acicola TaxID=111012 RepID=A0AAI8YWB9_9PEZI|nr:Aldose 1-epimerase [Lecanosticta acicola]
MLSSVATLLLAATTLVSAQSDYGGSSNASSAYPPFSGDPFQKYTLSAKGINASFIPYGARLTNLFVNDKNGMPQDVAVGYDNGNRYLQDTETNHTYFGAVVGRYANRIKNGTFTIDGQTSHIPTNEHGGANTLHGGNVGYDQANWTVVSHTTNSITFSFYDQHMSGFPGDVLNVASYTLTDDQAFISRLVSIPVNEATPIMLANHIYWNLGAFVTQDAKTILNDTLYMPYADRYIQTDGILVPNGSIALTNGTALDFTKPTKLGPNLMKATDFCGTGCTGIDNAFILDRSPYAAPRDPGLKVLQLSSPVTGIQMDLETNQGGLQIYSCVGQNGTIPVKQSQQHIQGNTTYVEKFGCIVIETQNWVAGIDYPQWGRNAYQIFSPTTEPAVNYQRYQFSIAK